MSWRVFTLLFFLLVGVGVFFAFYWRETHQEPNALVYNPFTEKFEPTQVNDHLNRSAIRQENLHNNPDGLRNYTILRGYFNAYDADAQILQFKDGEIKEVKYNELEHVNLTRDFLSNPESYLRHL